METRPKIHLSKPHDNFPFHYTGQLSFFKSTNLELVIETLKDLSNQGIPKIWNTNCLTGKGNV